MNVRAISVSRKETMKKYLFLASFLIVPLFLLIAFTLLPAVGVFGVGFLYWDGIGDPEFVGFRNFARIFSKAEYWQAFLNSGYYLVGAIVQLALALFLAALLTFPTRCRGFFRGVIFFPYLINGVAAGYMFYLFFEPDIGTLNSFLRLLGLTGAPNYLENTSINNILLAAVSIWRYLGLNFIMFLGVMASIEQDIYDAADLDGANGAQVFRYIILPSIRSVLFLNMLLAVKGAISVFEVPYIITGGRFGTSSFVIEAYNISFSSRPNVGMGSAMSSVLLVIVIIVSILQKLFFKEEKDDVS